MVKIDGGVVWPKPSFDFLSSYNLAFSFNKHAQNLKWLLSEKDFAVTI